MRPNTLSLRIAAITLSACIATMDAASAQEGAREYRIAQQSLDQALREFALTSNVDLLFPPDLVADKKSGTLEGKFTVEEGLRKLLQGSGLDFSVSGSRVVISEAAQGPTRLRTSSVPATNDSKRADMALEVDGAAVRPAVEEVIVTAQRREERLLDTPISIGLLTGAGLDNSSSRGVADVLNQVGGVSLVEVQPGNSHIAIRGVAPDVGVGTSTSGYYLDEVPFTFISTSQLPDASAFDLARVEVLRGSQGTLYGANALSGVVRVLTNDADPDRLEAKVRARVSDTSGSGRNYSGDLAVNVPLVPEVLAVRGVVSYSELSGYVDSTLSGQRRINDSQAQSYRLKANYQAGKNFGVKLGITRSNIENGAPAQALADMTTPFSADQADERVYDTYNLIAQ